MLIVHAFGTIDFLTSYMTDAEEDHGESPKQDLSLSGFHIGDGVRMTRSRITDVERSFHVICLGDDYDTSDENAMLLEDQLVIAFNMQSTPTPITYVEQDESQAVGDTWKCVGGLFTRDYRWRSAGLVSGMLTLHRSKS